MGPSERARLCAFASIREEVDEEGIEQIDQRCLHVEIGYNSNQSICDCYYWDNGQTLATINTFYVEFNNQPPCVFIQCVRLQYVTFAFAYASVPASTPFIQSTEEK